MRRECVNAASWSCIDMVTTLSLVTILKSGINGKIAPEMQLTAGDTHECVIYQWLAKLIKSNKLSSTLETPVLYKVKILWRPCDSH